MDNRVDLEAMVGHGDGDKPELRLWLRLLSTTTLIEHEIRRRLRRVFGMTLPQFDLLAQLYKQNEGLRLGELSRRLMVTNGNVTGLVDRLTQDGLIEREVLEHDRRVAVARLSERGRALFTEMATAHEAWLVELFSNCDREFLLKIRANIKTLKFSALQHAGLGT